MTDRSYMVSRLKESNLRATPQRIATLEVLDKMQNHPTVEQVYRKVREVHPEISLATVYNTLESFAQAGIVKKVVTDNDTMRYDPMVETHHHLYCAKSNRIEDYTDQELTEIISDYMEKHPVDGFDVKEIRLQIIGQFKE